MTATTQGRSAVCRCPACGQRFEGPGTARCPLCNFEIGDDRVTGADATPYAAAFAAGEPGWWAMCRWVWTASTERLKHLALMRSSAAARRFAWHTCLLLSLGLAVFQGTRVGWKWVGVAGEAAAALRPVGRGWLPIGSSVGGDPDLWWNPAQAVIGAVAAGVTGLAMFWLVRLLLSTGIGLSHKSQFRGEQRMSAALLYGSAWALPALLAAAVCLLRPLALVGEALRWTWTPSDATVAAGAQLLFAVSATITWIWLIRLGAMAPSETRIRVTAFFLIGAPLIIAGVAAGWSWALERTYHHLWVHLRLGA